MRLVYGATGLAALTALTTAIVAPPSTASSSPAAAVSNAAATPAIRQVTRYVTLQPGQTAPPQAVVTQLPAPSPRTVVVTTTRQSGAPKP